MENIQDYKLQKSIKGLHISMRFMSSHKSIVYKIKQFLSIYLDNSMTIQTHINKYENSFNMDIEFSTFLTIEVSEIVIRELKSIEDTLSIRKIKSITHESYNNESNIV